MKIGITFSSFDLLHAGHVKMLEEAKRQCDYLICGIQIDPTLDRPNKNKPTQTIVERYIQLKGCKFVDPSPSCQIGVVAGAVPTVVVGNAQNHLQNLVLFRKRKVGSYATG